MPRGETTPQGAVPRCRRLSCPGVGGGGLSRFQGRRDRGAPRRRRRGRASELRPQDLFPLAPPIPEHPGLSRPQQPGSELPRPADRLLQRSWDWGAGDGEDTRSWGARKRARLGQRGRGPGPRAPAGPGPGLGLGPGPLPGKVCDWMGSKEPGPAARTSGAQAGAPQRLLSCSPSPTDIHQPALLPHFEPARPPTPFPGLGEDPWLMQKVEMQKVESVAHIWPLQLWGEGIGFH